MRRRLHLGETEVFSVLEELRQEGQTDWLAMVQRFDKEAAIGEMDCFMSRWTTARPGGFSDADIAALRRLVPVLGLAIKSVSLARVAQSLVEAYLGRDAGRRVLKGTVSRGAAERINAVIWFSDMQGYTSTVGAHRERRAHPAAQRLCRDRHHLRACRRRRRAEADGGRRAGHLHGRRSGEACAAALRAEVEMRRKLAELNERRSAAGQPCPRSISACTSAMCSMATSAARTGSTSPSSARRSTRRAASPPCVAPPTATCCSRRTSATSLPACEQDRLVSVGRYALRGVGRAQELFTLDPELPP